MGKAQVDRGYLVGSWLVLQGTTTETTRTPFTSSLTPRTPEFKLHNLADRRPRALLRTLCIIYVLYPNFPLIIS